MKMKHSKPTMLLMVVALAILSVFVSGISGCSKKKGNPPPPGCQVTSVSLLPTNGTPETVNFTYGEDGRLKFVSIPGETIEMLYTTNGFRRISLQGNGWSTRSFVELDARGLPILKKDTTFNGQSITKITTFTFEYNSQQKLVKLSSDDALVSDQVFTWDNDNLVKYQLGNITYILDYYTEITNKDFGFIDFTLFLSLGVNPARSKNLLRSLTNNGNQMVFDYQFDEYGNIKSWEATVPGEPGPALKGTQSVLCN